MASHASNVAFADRVIAVRSETNFVTPARYEETPAFPVALEDIEWRRFGARKSEPAPR